MDYDTSLLNFRIKPKLKEQFEGACSGLRSNMTAEMNRMIREFVKRYEEYDDEPLSMCSIEMDRSHYDDL